MFGRKRRAEAEGRLIAIESVVRSVAGYAAMSSRGNPAMTLELFKSLALDLARGHYKYVDPQRQLAIDAAQARVALMFDALGARTEHYEHSLTSVSDIDARLLATQFALASLMEEVAPNEELRAKLRERALILASGLTLMTETAEENETFSALMEREIAEIFGSAQDEVG